MTPAEAATRAAREEIERKGSRTAPVSGSWRHAWVAVVVVVGAFFLATLRPGQDWALGDDFALYILHARNLVQGRAYASTGYLYNPDLAVVGPPAYPPVFPLLLAPVYAVFGLNLAAMKALVVGLFLCALTCLALLSRRSLTWLEIAVLVGVVGFNPYFWDLKDDILSDIPFLCFTYAGLLLARSVVGSTDRSRVPVTLALSLGVVLYLGYGTRIAGLALVAAVPLTDLLVRRPTRLRRATLLALGTFGVFALMQLVLVPGVQGYLDLIDREVQPATVGTQLVGNSAALGVKFLALWTGGAVWPLATVLVMVPMVLAVLGYVRQARHAPTVVEVFPLVYLALIVAWPRGREARFLIPLIPLAIYYALLGLRWVPRPRLLGGEYGSPALILGAMFLGLYATQYANASFGPIRSGIEAPDTKALFQFVEVQTGPGEVMVFRRPRALALFTGRPSAAYEPVPGGKDLGTFVAQFQPAYVVSAPQDRAYWACVSEKAGGGLDVVFRNSTYVVYRVAAQQFFPTVTDCARTAPVDDS